jgi:hypothetical protein
MSFLLFKVFYYLKVIKESNILKDLYITLLTISSKYILRGSVWSSLDWKTKLEDMCLTWASMNLLFCYSDTPTIYLWYIKKKLLIVKSI